MSTPKQKPFWDEALNKQVAEDIAEDARREHGVEGLFSPVYGLIEIFGAQRETRLRACRKLAQKLNTDSLNIAAKQRLPNSWRGDDTQLHVLTLIQWGIDEGRVAIPSFWETEDEAMCLFSELANWNPAYFLALIKNPEHPQDADEEVCIAAYDLEQAEDAETAASILMESLEIAANLGWPDGCK